MSETILKAEKISKAFIQGDTCIDVLTDFNMEIPSGKLVSITGSSGSGKSTLLQILGLLDSQYDGEVYILGEKTKSLSPAAKREIRLRSLGFVYQYHHLLKDFSARENIIMPALIAGQNPDVCLKKADEMLDNMGMVQRRFHAPSQLSGGEQQRVAIARALFNSPAIILADEPTGNLDPDTALKVFDMFLSYAIKQNTSVIFVTHNHSLAKRADSVIQL